MSNNQQQIDDEKSLEQIIHEHAMAAQKAGFNKHLWKMIFLCSVVSFSISAILHTFGLFH